MKNKSRLLSLLAVAQMLGGDLESMEERKKKCISNNLDKIDVTIHNVTPKGAKKYYFNKNGNILPVIEDKENPKYNSPIGEVAYECIALSKKRAIKKFEKYAN